MHQRISINTLCLSPAPFDQHVEEVASLGAIAIGPDLEEVMAYGAPAAARLLRDAGLIVATLTHRAFAYDTAEAAIIGRARLDATIALAATISARTITMTTGGRGALPWAEAARRFAAEIAPSAERAHQAGVVLSLEPTSHLYADASIAHRLSDTVKLAQMAGICVGIDLFACWVDSDIEDAIVDAGLRTSLVQVSDYVAGDRSLPCRAVPGEGLVPLARLIPLILRSGFAGYFDLEIIGPRLEAGGRQRQLRLAAERLASWIDAA